jgi:hypothetical protein
MTFIVVAIAHTHGEKSVRSHRYGPRRTTHTQPIRISTGTISDPTIAPAVRALESLGGRIGSTVKSHAATPATVQPSEGRYGTGSVGVAGAS